MRAFLTSGRTALFRADTLLLRTTGLRSAEGGYTATTEDIKSLRSKSGAGLLDCKNALNQFKGDHEQSMKYLKEKGLAKVQSRATASTGHGVVAVAIAPDGQSAAIIELNTETDFAARSEDFTNVATAAAQTIISHPGHCTPFPQEDPPSPEAVGSINGVVCSVDAPQNSCGKDGTVSSAVDSLQARLGERAEVKRAVLLKAPTEHIHHGESLLMQHQVAAYVHAKVPGTQCGTRATAVVVSAVEGVEPEMLRRIGTEVAVSCCTYHGLDGFKSWEEFGVLGKSSGTLKQMIEGRAKGAKVRSDGIWVSGIKTVILGAE